MWSYRKLTSNNSPMAEILSRCSDKSNLRLVVYHLSENHVECATTPDVDKLRLGETARTIKADSRHNHAILAFDMRTDEVYKIEDVPELPVASAVLLCVVTELLNGCVQPRENQYGAPRAAAPMPPRMPMPTREVMRDTNGRFVRKEREEEFATPTRVIKGNSAPLSGHRFRLGKH